MSHLPRGSQLKENIRTSPYLYWKISHLRYRENQKIYFKYEKNMKKYGIFVHPGKELTTPRHLLSSLHVMLRTTSSLGCLYSNGIFHPTLVTFNSFSFTKISHSSHFSRWCVLSGALRTLTHYFSVKYPRILLVFHLLILLVLYCYCLFYSDREGVGRNSCGAKCTKLHYITTIY